jgi:AraC family transcriptional activator of tynA and feaB
MNTMATSVPHTAPSQFDLKVVDAPQRAALWSKTARSFFPGLSVRDLRVTPTMGVLNGMPFGAGRLWTVLSPPLVASYDPACDAVDPKSQFSVMLQLSESTAATQGRHRCQLHPGDCCVIDGRLPFQLEVTSDYSRFMMLQLPRDAVLGRHPHLERQTAETFDASDGGVALLRQILLSILDSAPLLETDQRATALAAVIQMMGLPKPRSSFDVAEIGWRVRAALTYIDATMADHELTAAGIAHAQGISRRRLDEIMVQALGVSLTAQVWARRLSQAATDLIDPNRAAKSVSEIAFATGFADAAHFTRAFKRRYDCTPREWRVRGSASTSEAGRRAS